MLRIFHGTNYDFIRPWRIAVGITVAFIAIGLIYLGIHGINRSIEFTGGTLMQLEFTQPPNVADIGLLRELGLDECAAGELDAPIQPAVDTERDEADRDERDGDTDRDAPGLDEVVVGAVKDAQHGCPQMLSVWAPRERLSHRR